MTLISIKFSPDMETAIIEGRKCCTTRGERKGNVGDLFIVQDRLFRIVHIHHAAMHAIKEGYYDAEGFESPSEFAKFWKEHVGEFNPIQTGYLHFFAFIEIILGECDLCLLDELRICPFRCEECPGVLG